MDLKPIDLTNAEENRDREKSDRKFFLRYWIFFGGIAFVVIALLVRMWVTAPLIPTEKIADKNFESSANSVCKNYMNILYKQQLKKDEHLTNTKIATRVRKSTSTMQDLVDELDQLTVSPSDQAAVKRWLAEWNKYIDAGNRYADSLKSDNRSEWEAIGKESTKYSQTVTAFALTNEMKGCALVTQAPERSSPF